MDTHDFCDAVAQLVEDEYGLTDGDDLCYNLIEQGVIDTRDGVNPAARVVAQHMLQQ
jgi:hypothetical protein